jgi:hypothetical protein
MSDMTKRKGNKPVENITGYHEYWETELPVETIGKCKKCHQRDLLGDGYCISCWDKKTSSFKTTEKEWRKKWAKMK